ncbi:MAG: Smr/MutS family protein [Dehalococcoidales bacterium]|nr:Smr/MutS family protein [Dehalococcoidales bacterium]
MNDEVHLRHLTVDEALIKLDEFLHTAYQDGLAQVKVVHGKRGGIIRQAVHRELARHPLVQYYRLGQRGEGSEGVTIVQLSFR